MHTCAQLMYIHTVNHCGYLGDGIELNFKRQWVTHVTSKECAMCGCMHDCVCQCKLSLNSLFRNDRGRWWVLWPTTAFTCGTWGRRDQPSCTPSSSTEKGEKCTHHLSCTNAPLPFLCSSVSSNLECRMERSLSPLELSHESIWWITSRKCFKGEAERELSKPSAPRIQGEHR